MAAYESNEFGRSLKTRRAAFEWERGGRPTAETTLKLSSNELQEYDASGGAFSIFLPAEPCEGCSFFLSEIAGSANVVTLDGNGNQIDGVPSLTLNVAYMRRQVRWNGTMWNVIRAVN